MQLSRTSVLAAPVVIGLLFASTLAGIDRLGFRDVSHFYTPLYDYVAWRTSGDWLPLWNPLDQTGMPLVGETTTAVLYPIRYALFSLPISSETAVGWYIVLHLILASAAARIAARWSGVGPTSATLAGVIYPLSGAVLFLYCNPPFLVGAAWLPLVLGAMLARVDISVSSRVLIAGTSMSMMIYGGDPQTALHAMIVATAAWGVCWLRQSPPAISFRVLSAVPVLAAALSAPQLAASISWSSQSDRVRQGELERWFDPPTIDGKRYEAFQYSLAPWHTLELATPNAFGSMFPMNRRISRIFPGDGRIWTPSIYMGLLVLMALICRVRSWRSSGIDRWMAVALASLCLAMGHFGVVWLIQAITPWLPNVDSAIGGPYWWLYQFLPGYDSFRYPAKWLAFFSLASAIVTAQSADEKSFQKALGRIPVGLAVTLVTALAITLLLRYNPSLLIDPVRPIPSDEFWGPLDVDAGLSQIVHSLVHSGIALIAIGFVFRFRKLLGWSDDTLKLWLVVIVAVDLGVCGWGLIGRVPRRSEQQLVARFGSSTRDSETQWMRTQSGGGWPSHWKQTQDPERMLDVEASMRAAWFGRWHLADRACVLNNMVSIQSREMTGFWRATREVTADRSPDRRTEFWDAIRHWLSINGVVHTTNRATDVPIDGRTAWLVDRTHSIESPARSLRSHWRWMQSQPPGTGASEWTKRLRAIGQSGGTIVPVVQTKQDRILLPQGKRSDAMIHVGTQAAELAEFDIELTGTSLLSRAVFQDGHWTAQYSPAGSNQWQRLPVYRVDGLQQGVLLPAGKWKLRFRYAPWWLGWSLATAALSWSCVVVTTIRGSRRRPQQSVRR